MPSRIRIVYERAGHGGWSGQAAVRELERCSLKHQPTLDLEKFRAARSLIDYCVALYRLVSKVERRVVDQNLRIYRERRHIKTLESPYKMSMLTYWPKKVKHVLVNNAKDKLLALQLKYGAKEPANPKPAQAGAGQVKFFNPDLLAAMQQAGMPYLDEGAPVPAQPKQIKVVQYKPGILG